MDATVEEDGGVTEGEEVAGASYFLARAKGSYCHYVLHGEWEVFEAAGAVATRGVSVVLSVACVLVMMGWRICWLS